MKLWVNGRICAHRCFSARFPDYNCQISFWFFWKRPCDQEWTLKHLADRNNMWGCLRAARINTWRFLFAENMPDQLENVLMVHIVWWRQYMYYKTNFGLMMRSTFIMGQQTTTKTNLCAFFCANITHHHFDKNFIEDSGALPVEIREQAIVSEMWKGLRRYNAVTRFDEVCWPDRNLRMDDAQVWDETIILYSLYINELLFLWQSSLL
jgi:hypothetical protein